MNEFARYIQRVNDNINNKTLVESISNTDVGDLLKDVSNLILVPLADEAETYPQGRIVRDSLNNLFYALNGDVDGNVDNTNNWQQFGSAVKFFTDLPDTFASYTGKALKTLRVNAAENGLEVYNASAVFAPISHTHVAADITNFSSTTNSIINSQKGAANGLAPLDSGAKISTQYLPDSILGNVKFKGTYNGNVVISEDDELNGGPLPDSSSNTVGWYFIATADFDIYKTGDWIISNGDAGYTKVDNTDAVTSVFGRIGPILAVAGDYNTDLVTEATNLYFTTTRARNSISSVATGLTYTPSTGQFSLTSGYVIPQTTSNLPEGTNLYYTAARFNSAFADKSTSDLTEGTNLYFTNERVFEKITNTLIEGDGISFNINTEDQQITITNTLLAITTTDDIAEGEENLFFTTTRARNSISSVATGLTYSPASGEFSLTEDYIIPTVDTFIYNQYAANSSSSFKISGRGYIIGLSGQPIFTLVANDSTNLMMVDNDTKRVNIYQDAIINGVTVGQGNNLSLSNTALGENALASNNSGADSVMIGYGAGRYVTTATKAVGIGYRVFGNATATGGFGNIGIGYSALYDVTTGQVNIGIGYSALQSISTGSGNIAAGYQALFATTTGEQNIGIGYQVMLNNTTGSYNTVISPYQGLYYNTTGSFATGVGYGVLTNNTTGAYNTAMGYISLNANTTGNYNTAYGAYSMYLNTTGLENTAYGAFAGRSNTTGEKNVFIGYTAGFSNTTGSYNVVIGGANLPSATINQALLLADGSGAVKLYSPATHNIILGGTTDNTLGKLQVYGAAYVDTIANATSDTDKFLVSDGGVIKYRTGSELLSDIGAVSASSISGTTGKLAKFTASGAVGNSIMSESGNDILLNGIGNSSLTIQTNTSGSPTLYLTAAGSDGGAITYDRATSKIIFSNSGVANAFEITNSGAATFSSSVTTNDTLFVNTNSQLSGMASAKLVVLQDAGTADWAMGIQGGTSVGNSYGLTIRAGTNSSDYSLLIKDATNSTTLFDIRGNGAATFNSTLASGTHTITGNLNVSGYIYDTSNSEILVGADSGGFYFASGGTSPAIPIYIGGTNTTFTSIGGGNVGIGLTSSIIAKLQVRTATNKNLGVLSATTETAGVKLSAFNDAASQSIPFEYNGSIHLFKIGETEAFRVTANRNILINTTTDNNADKIQIDGSGSLTGRLSSLGITSITTATRPFIFGATNAGANYGTFLRNDGGVLAYFGDANGSAAGGGTTNDFAVVAASGELWLASDSHARFYTSGTLRMSIGDTSGNVSIGGGDNTGKLQVYGLTNIYNNNEYLSSTAVNANQAQYQSWYNSVGTRRGYFGYGSAGDNTLTLNNETGNLYLEGATTTLLSRSNELIFKSTQTGTSANHIISFNDATNTTNGYISMNSALVINNQVGWVSMLANDIMFLESDGDKIIFENTGQIITNYSGVFNTGEHFIVGGTARVNDTLTIANDYDVALDIYNTTTDTDTSKSNILRMTYKTNYLEGGNAIDGIYRGNEVLFRMNYVGTPNAGTYELASIRSYSDILDNNGSGNEPSGAQLAFFVNNKGYLATGTGEMMEVMNFYGSGGDVTWTLGDLSLGSISQSSTGLWALTIINSNQIFKTPLNTLARVTVANTNFTAFGGDELIVYTSLTAPRTVTLPSNPLSLFPGSSSLVRVFRIKDESGAAGTHNITIQVASSGTIDGASSKVINTNYGYIKVYYSGATGTYFTID